MRFVVGPEGESLASAHLKRMKICAIAYFSIARPTLARSLRDADASIRLNEHVAADDPAYSPPGLACQLICS
jgi:hypothetical protein